jgi:hypothetical protein
MRAEVQVIVHVAGTDPLPLPPEDRIPLAALRMGRITEDEILDIHDVMEVEKRINFRTDLGKSG